ncbi:hypothetical protein CKAH01_08457 [Colletotrichum kahawae]|uniref:Uncharacterized protein n=1 Tax=Colletotrichum kahawae TaxID=34407 RepID=A0AAD9Y2V7_COLKA|nr:hypothetical protein CKAH01_08457 [Colletotrichum kahawae]
MALSYAKRGYNADSTPDCVTIKCICDTTRVSSGRSRRSHFATVPFRVSLCQGIHVVVTLTEISEAAGWSRDSIARALYPQGQPTDSTSDLPLRWPSVASGLTPKDPKKTHSQGNKTPVPSSWNWDICIVADEHLGEIAPPIDSAIISVHFQSMIGRANITTVARGIAEFQLRRRCRNVGPGQGICLMGPSNSGTAHTRGLPAGDANQLVTQNRRVHSGSLSVPAPDPTPGWDAPGGIAQLC